MFLRSDGLFHGRASSFARTATSNDIASSLLDGDGSSYNACPEGLDSGLDVQGNPREIVES